MLWAHAAESLLLLVSLKNDDACFYIVCFSCSYETIFPRKQIGPKIFLRSHTVDQKYHLVGTLERLFFCDLPVDFPERKEKLPNTVKYH